MVIAHLTRPAKDDSTLVLYCKPTLVSEVISHLSDDELLLLNVEFVKVVE